MTDNDSLPNLAICMVTYNRTAEALKTLRSTIKNLGYPKDKIGWYIADDGSDDKHHSALLKELNKNDLRILGEHNERIRKEGEQDTYNAGKGWNLGLGICHQFSDFVLWLEDDWNLEKPLDLIPYVKILQEREDVGVLTFRILSIGADVFTQGYDGHIYLDYKKTTQYAYSGNPYLRHARFTRHVGWFAEDRSPGLIELEMDDKFRASADGIAIWRPVEISIWGGWAHIGTEKTWG